MVLISIEGTDGKKYAHSFPPEVVSSLRMGCTWAASVYLKKLLLLSWT